MTDVLAKERELYETVWASVDTYADLSPGVLVLPIFLDLIGEKRGTVLDAGCGSGKASAELRAKGFTVTMCDLTNVGLVPEVRDLPFVPACLWHDLSDIPRKSRGVWGRSTLDWIYCCDVLEHIPPQFTMLAIDQMLRIAREGVFLSITLIQDNLGVWAGQALHQTVESFVWWRDSLRELGTLVDARDLHQSATFYVKPRH